MEIGFTEKGGKCDLEGEEDEDFEFPSLGGERDSDVGIGTGTRLSNSDPSLRFAFRSVRGVDAASSSSSSNRLILSLVLVLGFRGVGVSGREGANS